MLIKLHTFNSGHTFKIFIKIYSISDDLQSVVGATVFTFYGILTSCTIYFMALLLNVQLNILNTNDSMCVCVARYVL